MSVGTAPQRVCLDQKHVLHFRYIAAQAISTCDQP